MTERQHSDKTGFKVWKLHIQIQINEKKIIREEILKTDYDKNSIKIT